MPTCPSRWEGRAQRVCRFVHNLPKQDPPRGVLASPRGFRSQEESRKHRSFSFWSHNHFIPNEELVRAHCMPRVRSEGKRGSCHVRLTHAEGLSLRNPARVHLVPGMTQEESGVGGPLPAPHARGLEPGPSEKSSKGSPWAGDLPFPSLLPLQLKAEKSRGRGQEEVNGTAPAQLT